MTSKKRYYELKEAGLCVKCTEPRGESPSTVRCQTCQDKFNHNRLSKKQARIKDNKCIQCGMKAPTGNSDCCIDCRQKNTRLKQKLSEKSIIHYKEEDLCKICGDQLDSIGTVCQTCISTIKCSKELAIARYGSKCNRCGELDISKLKLVASNIGESVSITGPEMHKVICFSTLPPPDYQLLCHNCYWTENITYIKEFKRLLEQEHQNTVIDLEDEKDIIDIQ